MTEIWRDASRSLEHVYSLTGPYGASTVFKAFARVTVPSQLVVDLRARVGGGTVDATGERTARRVGKPTQAREESDITENREVYCLLYSSSLSMELGDKSMHELTGWGR